MVDRPDCTAGMGAGPSHRSQSSVSGTGGVSSAGQSSPAARPVGGPDMHLADRTNGPVPDPLAHQPHALTGVALIAHLGGHLGLAGGLGQFTRL